MRHVSDSSSGPVSDFEGVLRLDSGTFVASLRIEGDVMALDCRIEACVGLTRGLWGGFACIVWSESHKRVCTKAVGWRGLFDKRRDALCFGAEA
jgi:hypothetical protein